MVPDSGVALQPVPDAEAVLHCPACDVARSLAPIKELYEVVSQRCALIPPSPVHLADHYDALAGRRWYAFDRQKYARLRLPPQRFRNDFDVAGAQPVGHDYIELIQARA